ncbi:hypothetical protein ACJVC5_17625 [Peredibacter sp. HCB2-198]|uniref:hypothetical protein n=1 Tax=Peredibacter sp. HCB2-198 TaxID=3383025 RepID=UPI0038B65B6E
MKFWALMFLLLTSQFVFSQEEDCEEDGSTKLVAAVMKQSKAEESKNCPNQKKMESICTAVDDKTKVDSPEGKIRFVYQKKFLEAACANPASDSPEEVQSKVAKMWLKFRDKLVCNSVSFDVENGSVLKYAVAIKFDEFIYDVTKWKLDLNKVDASDNRTVLDYIKFQIERNKGNSLEPKLKSYYNRFKAAGAKHKSEL